MKETITTVEDERIVSYSRVLKKALEFEKNIKRSMRKGEGTIYFEIDDKTGSHSSNLEVGNDLLPIAQGAAFGAYNELAFKPEKQINEETGEKRRVIDPNGKAIADGIRSDISR